MAQLVKVKHRYMKQGEQSSLGGRATREAAEDCWVNPAHIVLISSDDERFQVRFVVGTPIIVNAEDRDRLVGIANGR